MVKLGLRTKFFLYSNTLIVGTMTLVTLVGVAHERAVRHDAIASRGISIAEAMAIPITDALMYEELGLVQETGLIENYISEILDRNRDLLRYVVVADTSGRVIHSNRWPLLGKAFARGLGPDAISRSPQVDILEVDGERVLEVRTTAEHLDPVLGLARDRLLARADRAPGGPGGAAGGAGGAGAAGAQLGDHRGSTSRR